VPERNLQWPISESSNQRATDSDRRSWGTVLICLEPVSTKYFHYLQGLGLEVPRGQKWKSGLEHFGLGLEENVLQFFKTFVVILDGGSEQLSKAHHGILWETTKAVCHSEAVVWENLLRSMLHISLSWELGYLTMWAIVRLHRRQ